MRSGNPIQGAELKNGTTPGRRLMSIRGNTCAGFALMRKEGIVDDTSTRST